MIPAAAQPAQPTTEPTAYPDGHTDALKLFNTESDTLQKWLHHARKWLHDFAQRDPSATESRMGARLVELTAAMAGYLRNNGPWDVAEQAHDTAYEIAERLTTHAPKLSPLMISVSRTA
ncbi:MAG: hypothetical protein ACRDQY_11020 [Pseudonocardiaceae bacterium]